MANQISIEKKWVLINKKNKKIDTFLGLEK